jgi:8-oxo-dGTP diphosphatase
VTTDRPELAVGAIVVEDGALLLVRRAQAPAAGRWSVPGGRVEHGEMLTDALVREVREETGLEVAPGELAGWVERVGEGHHFVILDFFARVASASNPPVPGDDVDRAEWVPLDQLENRTLVDGLADFLQRAGVLAE